MRQSFGMLMRPSLWRATAAFAGLILVGCGSSLYERRLDETKAMFTHMQLLDDNLAKEWTDPPTQISLRVPSQFRLMPAPVPPEKPAEGEEAAKTEVVDERQPDYLNIELPGIRGAFRAELAVAADASAATEMQSGYLYILTNHHLAGPTEENIKTASEFTATTVEQISQAVHVSIKEEDWMSDKFPLRPEPFLETISYQSTVLSPTEPLKGVVRKFSIYLFSQGDIQVILLFVIPESVVPGEKIVERIPLCLETFMMTGDKLRILPKDGSAPVDPGSAPKSGF